MITDRFSLHRAPTTPPSSPRWLPALAAAATLIGVGFVLAATLPSQEIVLAAPTTSPTVPHPEVTAASRDCSAVRCPAAQCGPDEEPSVPDGGCCQQCQEKPGNTVESICAAGCDRYTDGCNNCTCGGPCTKRQCHTHGTPSCLDERPTVESICAAGCDRYTDGCNDCTCGGACTERACFTQGTPKCLDEPNECPNSPAQACRMQCKAKPQCKNKECVMRVGNCCKFVCSAPWGTPCPEQTCQPCERGYVFDPNECRTCVCVQDHDIPSNCTEWNNGTEWQRPYCEAFQTDCQPNHDCGGQKLSDCHSACPLTCNQHQPQYCVLVCVGGYACTSPTPYWDPNAGRCVARNECSVDPPPLPRGAVLGRALLDADGRRHVATTDVDNEWSRIGASEHASIASFARAALDLMRLGAPTELVRATLAAADDEARHADAAFALAKATPGNLEVAPQRAVVTMASVARAAIAEGGVTEPLGVRAAERALQGPLLRRERAFYTMVVRDETRHAELAWRTVKWCLERDPSLRPAVLDAYEQALAPYDADARAYVARFASFT